MDDEALQQHTNETPQQAKLTRGKVDWIAVQIAKGTPAFKLVSAIGKRYAVSRKTAYTWLKTARKELAKLVPKSAEELVAQQSSRLERIIADPDTPASVRVSAIAEANRLFGLHKPDRVHVTGDGNGKGLTLPEIVKAVEAYRQAEVIDAQWVGQKLGLPLPTLSDEQEVVGEPCDDSPQKCNNDQYPNGINALIAIPCDSSCVETSCDNHTDAG